jgi:very-short-patch-repair endonuclease
MLDRLGKRGRRGTARFRDVLAARRPGEPLGDSTAERRLTQLLAAHGLPPVVPQHQIRDDDGRLIARVDFAYPELRIAIEYDSYEHHVGKIALDRDAARRNAIVSRGWLSVTATARDLRDGGHRLAIDLHRARSLRSGVEVGE